MLPKRLRGFDCMSNKVSLEFFIVYDQLLTNISLCYNVGSFYLCRDAAPALLLRTSTFLYDTFLLSTILSLLQECADPSWSSMSLTFSTTLARRLPSSSFPVSSSSSTSSSDSPPVPPNPASNPAPIFYISQEQHSNDVEFRK